MTEIVVNGVLPRRVLTVMELLCDKSYSQSTVSEACEELDTSVDTFRNCHLKWVYPFITLDATYFKVRENLHIHSKALMIAYATTCDGLQEIIGFGIYDKENKENWKEFLTSLKLRGLSEVYMITSDAHEGIIDAVAKQFPQTA